MSRELISQTRTRRAFADVALLVTTAALVVSLVVAATVVSIGIARADTLAHVPGSGGGRLAAVAAAALLIAGIGGLVAAMVSDGSAAPRGD